MSDKSSIEWTDATWSPVTGCSKVSPGCAHCYAELLSHRFAWTSEPWTPKHAGENVALHPERLNQPLRWKRPRIIFVCSMADLFHEEVPDHFIGRVFHIMAAAKKHTFQVLTKRPTRMLKLLTTADWGLTGCEYSWPLSNVWLGVSAENQRWADERIPLLLETPAAVRFVSLEPLLGPVKIGRWLGEACCRPDTEDDTLHSYECVSDPSSGIGWVIVGSESGPQARPMNEDWVRAIRDQCQAAGVSLFYKQRLEGRRKISMPELDGKVWNEMPTCSVDGDLGGVHGVVPLLF